jgi:hypothetical protein
VTNSRSFLKKSNKNGIEFYSSHLVAKSLITEWKLVTPDDAIYFIDRVYSSPVSVSAVESTYKEKVKEILNET